MFEPQHLLDLQDTHQAAGGRTDEQSWLSAHHTASSPTSVNRTISSLPNAAPAGTVDPVLFHNLVQMVPLVESLIDPKPNSSFTRRGSVIYTKTPSRESLYRKTNDLKARNGAHSIVTKRNKKPNKALENNADSMSLLSSRSLPTEKDMEELLSLREQVDDLQRKLSEKDELLKSGDTLKAEMASLKGNLNELSLEASQKDYLLKSTLVQLSDTKIKLADKQAAVEKLQWEATNSNLRVEKLRNDLEVAQEDISSFMLVFEGLARNTFAPLAGTYEDGSCLTDHNLDLDSFTEAEMQKLEAARQAYTHAVAAAKEKQDDESIAAAAKARMHIQACFIQPMLI